MHGAKIPLPQYAFMAWCLVKKEHRHIFTFTFTFTYDAYQCVSSSRTPVNAESNLNCLVHKEKHIKSMRAITQHEDSD
jgi:hypothetical protein